MTAENLKEIVLESLDPQFTLCEVVISDAQRTVFRVMSSGEPGRPLALIIDTSDDPQSNAQRYREARFLNHPKLLSISSISWLSADNGSEKSGIPYILTTCPDEVLATRLQPHAPTLPVMLEASRQILAALEYLHSENLLYCALRAASVWRIGDNWVLSDYSQLRVPGTEAPEDARRLLVQKGITAPPEVYFGQVSPAWDVWSFGAMLGRLLSPVRKRGDPEPDLREPLVLPAEIEEVIANCSAPEPNSRPSVAELKQFFEAQEAKSLGRHMVAAAVGRTASTGETAAIEPESPSRPAVESILNAAPVNSAFDAVPPRFRPTTDRTERSAREVARESRSKVSRIPWSRLVPVLALSVGLLLALLLIGRKPAVAKKTAPVQTTPPVSAQPAAAVTPAKAKPQPPPPANEESAQPESDQDEKAQIAAVLQQWVSATRDRNVADDVSCYGPVVDTYYGRHHVTAAELEQDKQRSFSEIGRVRKFDMDQIKFDHMGPGWAVVSFNKHWAFGNSGGYAGTAREQLVLREIGDEWKITSERELKVFFVRGRRPDRG
jgi:serine/threonine protein kinase